MLSRWLGAYKALLVPPPYGTGDWELFNLDEDPGESKNLREEMPEKLEELVAAFDAYAEAVGIVPWEPAH